LGFEISGLEISILRAWAWPKLTYIHVYTYFALILGAATQLITPLVLAVAKLMDHPWPRFLCQAIFSLAQLFSRSYSALGIQTRTRRAVRSRGASGYVII
jgi:hypothetical protein